jgi:acetyl-CoA acetyltransferase
MREAVIVDAVRTPVGRFGGALKDIRSDDLAALCIAEIVRRNHLNPNKIEDVILGCTNQSGEDNRNVARMALLLAGLPYSADGLTVNRLYASRLNAVNGAAHAIKVDEGDVFIAGGVESMTRAHLSLQKQTLRFRGRSRPAIPPWVGVSQISIWREC